MKKILAVAVTLLVITISLIAYKTFKVPEVPIHYHANFAVFINNTKVNFSDPSYMHLAPCVADYTIISFNKRDNVHLHDQVGNVVHVHQGKIVWNDLFKSIKYDLFKGTSANPKNTLNIYLNEKKVDKTVLNQTISKQSKLLFSVDEQTGPEKISDSPYFKAQYDQVGDSAKDYDNGTKGAEHCGAKGKRTYITRLKLALQTLFSDVEI